MKLHTAKPSLAEGASLAATSPAVCTQPPGLAREWPGVRGPGRLPGPPLFMAGNFVSTANGNPSFCVTFASRLTAEGWPVLWSSAVPSRPLRLLDMVLTTWRRRHAYAVAHVDVYSGLAFLWAEMVAMILRLAGKPFVLTLHGGSLPEFAAKHPARVMRLLARAARVTTPSSFLHETMKGFRQDLTVIPNPIDLATYRYRLRRSASPHLVWLRAFHRIYNPSLAPRVVRSLLEKGLDARLTMIGPDKGDGSRQETEKEAERLRVRDRIAFVGKISKADVPGSLGAHDIFLNTTDVDNTPISVIEAMACGLCVVSTDVGGLPYLLSHEADALLVPPADADAMAAAVTRIVQEPALSEGLSRRARAKAETFDWGRVLPQWQELFSHVARGDTR